MTRKYITRAITSYRRVDQYVVIMCDRQNMSEKQHVRFQFVLFNKIKALNYEIKYLNMKKIYIYTKEDGK